MVLKLAVMSQNKPTIEITGHPAATLYPYQNNLTAKPFPCNMASNHNNPLLTIAIQQQIHDWLQDGEPDQSLELWATTQSGMLFSNCHKIRNG